MKLEKENPTLTAKTLAKSETDEETVMLHKC